MTKDRFKDVSKGTFFMIILATVLSLVEFVSMITVMASSKTAGQDAMKISYAVVMVMYLLVLYYVLFGYKKPHGNMLRYLFVAFAAHLAICVALSDYYQTFTILRFLYLPALIIVSYIAGRLNKITKNSPLMIATTIIFVIVAIVTSFSVLYLSTADWILCFNELILWFDLVLVYQVRFKLHKEAGLLDDANKKLAENVAEEMKQEETAAETAVEAAVETETTEAQ